MNIRHIRSLLCLSLVVLSVIGLCGPASATTLYDVTLTIFQPLAGTHARMAFDFIDGDGIQNNSITTSLFATNGTLSGASNTNTLGASGNLPGKLTLNDTEFFNESTRDLTLGSTIKFRLAATENYTGGTPDSFSFFMLDTATGTTPVVNTDDPTGANALFALDIDGSPGGKLSVFNPTTAGINYSITAVTPVPEIPAAALPVFMLLFGGIQWHKRSLASRLSREQAGL